MGHPAPGGLIIIRKFFVENQNLKGGGGQQAARPLITLIVDLLFANGAERNLGGIE
jgi:hypothetical protein